MEQGIRIKPLLTKFCIEAPDGWRYYTNDYEAHVSISLLRLAPRFHRDRKLHFRISKCWEWEIEEKFDLPSGHLRGIFDLHRDRLEVEQLAYSEKLRLSPKLSQLAEPVVNAPKVDAHANLTLVYKICQAGTLQVSLVREVIAEARAKCTCILCAPLDQRRLVPNCHQNAPAH